MSIETGEEAGSIVGKFLVGLARLVFAGHSETGGQSIVDQVHLFGCAINNVFSLPVCDHSPACFHDRWS